MQALLLLNDPTYVESARKLAERVMLPSIGDKERFVLVFRIVLSRSPSDTEQNTMQEILKKAHAHFAANPAAAEAFLGVGQSAREATLNPVDLAAWTAAMSVMLNLDESISKL